MDPERHQLLEHAARMGMPLAPGTSEDLLVTDGAHAAAALALILATPMRNGLFRGVEVWSQGRQPPSPSDYTVLESGALSMNVDAPGANPGTRLPQAGGRASRPARSRVSVCAGAMTALDDALRASDGATVAVSDEAILDAERSLGRAEGIYAEPASAATLAGLEAAIARGIVAPGESATLVVTGTGLKDTASARDLVDGVEHVAATPDAVPDRK